MPRAKTTQSEFAKLLASPEGQNLEFKNGKDFTADDIAEYATGFFNAQMGDSRLVIGVEDPMPRDVCGISTFRNIRQAEQSVEDQIGIHVPLEEYGHEAQDGRKRVLIAHCPGGTGYAAIRHKGRYRIRRGDSLVDMTDAEVLDRLSAFSVPDYSARPVEATFADLDHEMINSYMAECSRKIRIGTESPEAFLHNTRLMSEGYATLAAVILFGTKETVCRLVPASEISYVYSPDEHEEDKATIKHDHQQGMWGYLDELWKIIDDKNPDMFYQHKFARPSIRTFDEYSVREAVINAITHRDYAYYGHILVKQFRYSIEISSPGGFVRGVDADNIINNSQPRNDLLAQAFQNTGRVERTGYGVGKMFDIAMAQGKPLPDFSNSTSSRVRLKLAGEFIHTKLVEYIRHAPNMSGYKLSVDEYRALGAIALGESVPDDCKHARRQLLDDGIIKSSGTGKAAVYSLAVDTYNPTELFNGEQETVTQLLEKLVAEGQDGIAISVLIEAVGNKSEKQVRRLLNAMRRDGLVRNKGRGRSSRWIATDKGASTWEASSLM